MKTGALTKIKFMVAKREIDSAINTPELQIEVLDYLIRERFIVIKTLQHLLMGPCFLITKNHAIFVIRMEY